MSQKPLKSIRLKRLASCNWHNPSTQHNFNPQIALTFLWYRIQLIKNVKRRRNAQCMVYFDCFYIVCRECLIICEQTFLMIISRHIIFPEVMIMIHIRSPTKKTQTKNQGFSAWVKLWDSTRLGLRVGNPAYIPVQPSCRPGMLNKKESPWNKIPWGWSGWNYGTWENPVKSKLYRLSNE